MALAIWIGARVEHIRFNQWGLAGLLGAAVLAAIARLLRQASLATLAGSPVLALWLATRFLVTPAAFLIALAWLVSWALGLSAAPALLKALTLTLVYGGGAILATSALADLTAAIKGPTGNPPSAS
jgi:hypothetical protein